MAARTEYELGQDKTLRDLEGPDDEEGRTEPFSEVARAEAAVERSRERVERSVTALRLAFARRTDWRGWVARQPGLVLGAAMLVGFLWGYRSHGGRASNRR
jgi:hypothetical protein